MINQYEWKRKKTYNWDRLRWIGSVLVKGPECPDLPVDSVPWTECTPSLRTRCRRNWPDWTEPERWWCVSRAESRKSCKCELNCWLPCDRAGTYLDSCSAPVSGVMHPAPSSSIHKLIRLIQFYSHLFDDFIIDWNDRWVIHGLVSYSFIELNWCHLILNELIKLIELLTCHVVVIALKSLIW